MLKPVAPPPPKSVNIQPQMTAPTMPNVVRVLGQPLALETGPLTAVWSVRRIPVAKSPRQKSTPLAVLVAEDEPTVRALAESIIEELGYTTFSAANAREALAVLEGGAAITLLFTDINMPDGPNGLDGLELARR